MATQLSAPGQTRTMRPRPLQHNTRQARRCPRIRERRTGRESIQFSRCAKPNESPQRAGRRLSRGQERMFRRSTRRRSRDSAVVAAERTWALGPPPAITLQSGREGLPPSMAHRSNGASASASIVVPRAKLTSSASAATKPSANKPLRSRCQWVCGSEGGWRAVGGCAHKAHSARHCRVGSCRLCPSAYARPAAAQCRRCIMDRSAAGLEPRDLAHLLPVRLAAISQRPNLLCFDLRSRSSDRTASQRVHNTESRLVTMA